MSNKLYEETSIQNIANAIRERTDTTETMKVADMSSKITQMPVLATKEGTSSITYNAIEYGVNGQIKGNTSQDEGLKGYNLTDEIMEQGGISGTTGLPSPTTSRVRTTNFIEVKPNTNYIINAITTQEGKTLQAFFFFYAEDGTFLSSRVSSYSTIPKIMPKYDDVYKVKIAFRYSGNYQIFPEQIEQVQLIEGDETKQYVPYQNIGIKRANNNTTRIDHIYLGDNEILINDELNITNGKAILKKASTQEEIDLGYVDLKSIEGQNNVEVLATLEPTYIKETYIKG